MCVCVCLLIATLFVFTILTEIFKAFLRTYAHKYLCVCVC